MREFLIAEWKTIVAVVLFCSAIFGWFYLDEIQKAEAAAAPYVYTCLKPGAGLMHYDLGKTASDFDLTGFTVSRDEPLDVVRYTRTDGAIELAFRHEKLAAAIFYPDKTAPITSCQKDAEQILKNLKPIGQPIDVEDRINNIYLGIVQIEQNPPVDPNAPDEKNAEQTSQNKTIGWLVLGE